LYSRAPFSSFPLVLLLFIIFARAAATKAAGKFGGAKEADRWTGGAAELMDGEAKTKVQHSLGLWTAQPREGNFVRPSAPVTSTNFEQNALGQSDLMTAEPPTIDDGSTLPTSQRPTGPRHPFHTGRR
jgi:hypothetical protein